MGGAGSKSQLEDVSVLLKEKKLALRQKIPLGVDDQSILAFVPTILHTLVSQNFANFDKKFQIEEEGGAPSRRSSTTTFTGSCLQADILGYTKISSMFSEQESSGLDEFLKHTSDFFEAFVQTVYAHGGDDVSMYSQDMQAKHTPLELCCMSVFNCGLKLVGVCTDMLTLHVGITCGDMQLTSLGGFKNEWTYVLTGQIMSMLASCIDDTSSCQVAVTSDVYTNLCKVVDFNQLNVTCAESGNYIFKTIQGDLLTTPVRLINRFTNMCTEKSVVEVMRRFAPPTVLNGTLDDTVELRVVTTVFLKLDSYCPIKNADPVTLQPLFIKIQEALRESGGYLNEFSIDEYGGCFFIAMWGVPSFTFQDNGARATSFALTMHKSLADLGHKCSIGVTTGNALCGIVGCLYRRFFVGIGAKVYLAARLMRMSKGGIYIDEDVVTKSCDEFRLRPDLQPEKILFKGYPGVHAYHLTGLEDNPLQHQLQFLRSLSKPPLYPMYVLKISDLSLGLLTELPCHEDARREGILKEVVEREGFPGQLFVYSVDREGCRGDPIEYDIIENEGEYAYETKEKVFTRAEILSISHRWFRPSFDPRVAHPDGADNRKFTALVQYLSENHPTGFVWMDYFSIPQDPARRDLQEAAIQSLPSYFMYSSNTLVLCDTFESLVDQQKGYLSRGHCLLELVTTKLPRIDVFGKWYVPGFEEFGQWGKTVALEIKTSDTREITWEHFASAGSPVNGNFTVEQDRNIIRPLLETYVEAFRAFHAYFLQPMLACESWEAVMQLPDAQLPQLWNTHEFFETPQQWCEYVLPIGYADMLAEGQAKKIDFKRENQCIDDAEEKQQQEIVQAAMPVCSIASKDEKK